MYHAKVKWWMRSRSETFSRMVFVRERVREMVAMRAFWGGASELPWATDLVEVLDMSGGC